MEMWLLVTLAWVGWLALLGLCCWILLYWEPRRQRPDPHPRQSTAEVEEMAWVAGWDAGREEATSLPSFRPTPGPRTKRGPS